MPASAARLRLERVLLTLAFALVWLSQTRTQAGSWNDNSHLATIEALANRGTWAIDQSPFLLYTRDILLVQGHLYSDRSTMLSLLGTGAYLLNRAVAGGVLAPGACAGLTACPYVWITFLVAGLPSALMLGSFYGFLRRGQSAATALVVTGSLGLATMIWPYSLVLNSHVPAAAALWAGYYLLYLDPAAESPVRLGLAGLSLGLAVTLDPLTALPAGAALVIYVAQRPRAALPLALGLSLPCAIAGALNFQIIGSPLPLYTYTEGYDYPGSPFPPTLAGQEPAANIPRYVFDLLVGQRGFLLQNPILVLALLSLARTMRDPADTRRPLAWAVGFGLTGMLLYLSLNTGEFNGGAYGIRTLAPVVPLLCLFLPAWVATPRTDKLLIFALAAALSFLSARQGAVNPWQPFPPIIHLTFNNPFLRRVPPPTPPAP